MKAKDFLGRDVLSMRDFDREQIVALLDECSRFEQVDRPLLHGKVLGSLFFEPSTRTRLSFESAMSRLGGTSIGFTDAITSSATKGESLWDTVKVVEGYCDVLVIRHPAEGSARLAAEAARKPVINGGDGSNQHPTQTLLDLYTIRKRAGRLDDLRIAFVGDLKFGRTVHSLIRSLALFGAEMWMVAPEGLGLPQHSFSDLDEMGARYHVRTSLEDTPADLDILYMTRIQQERFTDAIEYERVKNSYQLDREAVERFHDNVVILHPLPRTTELDPALDDHPGAAYFDQAHNGVVVRKTLLATLLGIDPS